MNSAIDFRMIKKKYQKQKRDIVFNEKAIYKNVKESQSVEK